MQESAEICSEILSKRKGKRGLENVERQIYLPQEKERSFEAAFNLFYFRSLPRRFSAICLPSLTLSCNALRPGPGHGRKTIGYTRSGSLKPMPLPPHAT